MKKLILILLLQLNSFVIFAQIIGSHTIKYCTFMSFTDDNGDCIHYSGRYLGESEDKMFLNLGDPATDWQQATTSPWLSVVDDVDGWGKVAVFIDHVHKRFAIYSDNNKTHLLGLRNYFSFVGWNQKSYRIYYDQFTEDSGSSTTNSGQSNAGGQRNSTPTTPPQAPVKVNFYNPNGASHEVTLYGVLTYLGSSSFDFCASQKAFEVRLTQGHNYSFQFDHKYVLTWKSFDDTCNGSIRSYGTLSSNNCNGCQVPVSN